MTTRIEWSPELQALIDAQRTQDDMRRAEQDALDALADVQRDGDADDTVCALDMLRAAQNAHEASIVERIGGEIAYRQWWDRERASGVPHSIHERQSA